MIPNEFSDSDADGCDGDAEDSDSEIDSESDESCRMSGVSPITSDDEAYSLTGPSGNECSDTEPGDKRDDATKTVDPISSHEEGQSDMNMEEIVALGI